MEYVVVIDDKIGNVVFEQTGQYIITDSPNSFGVFEIGGDGISGPEIARFSFNRYSYRIQRVEHMEAYG